MSRRIVRWSAALAVAAGVVFGSSRTDAQDSTGKLERLKFEKEITVTVKLDYLLYLPEGYGKEDKQWPLVLFLHGLGDKIERLRRAGLPRQVEQKNLPLILIAPQNPDRGWDVQNVNALLDEVVAKHKVDKDRIYVTGLSMGGFGTWSLAAAHPDKFAAIIPICGGGNTSDAKKIKHLPIWVFHGAKDTTVPASRSEAMVKALKDAGAENVKFTLYPDAGHDSWTETYRNPEVWEWLLKQKRGGDKLGGDPLPKDEEIVSIEAFYRHPDLRKGVKFTLTLPDWKGGRAGLLPAQTDDNPANWEGLGSLTFKKKDGQSFWIELYYGPKDEPGAFSAGKTFEQRVYYRGGKTRDLIKAMNAAYEASKADKPKVE